MDKARHAGSFRDPSGFIFAHKGEIYRQVNPVYKEHYEQLVNSGLYDELVRSNLLISHEEVELDGLELVDAYKVLKPERVRFVSYPYEWSFSQLKDAALVTLEVQKKALDFGMTLKDSSAYNIQFLDVRPSLIDTLSFESYQDGNPWVAYRQFCQHFLVPLALMEARVGLPGCPLRSSRRTIIALYNGALRRKWLAHFGAVGLTWAVPGDAFARWAPALPVGPSGLSTSMSGPRHPTRPMYFQPHIPVGGKPSGGATPLFK